MRILFFLLPLLMLLSVNIEATTDVSLSDEGIVGTAIVGVTNIKAEYMAGKCIVDGEKLTKVVNGRERFLPIKDAVLFELSNGSQMDVLICKNHKKNLKNEQFASIMNNVFGSWEWEITKLNNWTEEQQQHYRNRHYHLKIKGLIR